MDLDENDILFTNKFIRQPNVQDEIEDLSSEFRRFYKKEQEKQDERILRESLERSSLRSIILDEETDSNNLLNTNKFDNNIQETMNIQRTKREIKTYVSVDSRDRDKLLYLKPNNFKIFLGRTFYNVKTIRLASIEFPNTNAVINANNNKIYWTNQEDIDEDIVDNIIKDYPVYEIEVPTGSYVAPRLQSQISSTMSLVKRQNKTGEFHFFSTTLDINTDIVQFTSLIQKELPNNPFTIIGSDTEVRVSAPGHGYNTGQIIYITGAKTLAGIPSETLNAAHEITVINSNVFSFEVNIKAAENSIGGGNTVRSGRLAPFKLLYGEYTNTIAPNLGYPLENSSQRNRVSIQRIENIYQVRVTTREPHGFENSYTYINQPCTLTGTGTSLNGTRVITDIVDQYTFLIQVSLNQLLNTSVFNTGTITFPTVDGQTFNISTLTNFGTSTLLIITHTKHNYTWLDKGLNLSLFETNMMPDINTEHQIYGILSPNEVIIGGFVLQDSGNYALYQGGYIPTYKPIETTVLSIIGVNIGAFTTFECDRAHNFRVGDKIRFYNILTIPTVLETVYEVYTIPSSTQFTINLSTTSYQLNPNSKVGSGTIAIYYPYHGFNTITSITNNTNLSGFFDGTYVVETRFNHGLSAGDKVSFSKTNCVPLIDKKYEIGETQYQVQSVLSSDTFVINASEDNLGNTVELTTIGTEGILGLNQDLYIYGETSVGGISKNDINGKKYNVREVLDEHSFTVDVNGIALSLEQGGTDIYISSLLHGYNGVQQNTKNSIVNRSINLEGENYAFLCCPQLATMMNTGKVKDIFARILLDQSPGYVVFSYLSNPKEFDTVPLDKLSDLEFSVVNYDNSLYDFSDLDFSFVLEITEVIDTTENFNYSSKRGITNN